MTSFLVMFLPNVFGYKKDAVLHVQEMTALCDLQIYQEKEDIQLAQVELPAVAKPSPDVILWVDNDEYRFNDVWIQEQWQREELVNGLHRHKEELAYLQNDGTQGLVIAFDSATKASRVAETVSLIQEVGYSDLYFVFEASTPVTLPTPPHQKKYDKMKHLAQTSASVQKEVMMVRQLEKDAGFCRGIDHTFAAVAFDGISADQRCLMLMKGTEISIPRCPFMNAKKFTSGLQVLMELSYSPMLHSITIDTELSPISIRPEETWLEISSVLLSYRSFGGVEVQGVPAEDDNRVEEEVETP